MVEREGRKNMEAIEEKIHDYPKPLDSHWKENWYFNFIDKENRAWGVNHFSLAPFKSSSEIHTQLTATEYAASGPDFLMAWTDGSEGVTNAW